MALYHFDCHKCTNKYVAPDGGTYCKPGVDAFYANMPWHYTWDWHDGSGKNAEAWCEGYTTEQRPMEIYPLYKRP